MLGFDFGEGVPTLGASSGNDLAGFFAVNIGGFVHAIVSGFQHLVLFAQGRHGLDSQIGGVVGRDVALDQPFHSFFTALTTD